MLKEINKLNQSSAGKRVISLLILFCTMRLPPKLTVAAQQLNDKNKILYPVFNKTLVMFFYQFNVLYSTSGPAYLPSPI